MGEDTGYFKREDSKVEMLQVVSILGVMLIFQLPWDNPDFMTFKTFGLFFYCSSQELLKTQDYEVLYPGDQFKDLKLTIVEIFSWATNSVWILFTKFLSMTIKMPQ